MAHIEQARETFHIDDKTFSKVMDLMDEARAAIKKGADYDKYIFEQKMRRIVVAPAGTPAYDHHMVIEIAEAFGLDGRWEEVYPTLYKDDITGKYPHAKQLSQHCTDCWHNHNSYT